MTGIMSIWSIIPGMAVVIAPAKNAEIPKLLPLSPVKIYFTAPHTSRPDIIETKSEAYTKWFFLGKTIYIIPQTRPYVASSNAIGMATISGGIAKIK